MTAVNSQLRPMIHAAFNSHPNCVSILRTSINVNGGQALPSRPSLQSYCPYLLDVCLRWCE